MIALRNHAGMAVALLAVVVTGFLLGDVVGDRMIGAMMAALVFAILMPILALAREERFIPE